MRVKKGEERSYVWDGLKIMVVSTPKTGNTWVKNLLSAIYRLPIMQIARQFDPAEMGALGEQWVTYQHHTAQPQIIKYGERNNVAFVTPIRHPADALLSKFHFVRNYIDSLEFSDIDLSPLMARDGDTMGPHTAYYVKYGFPVSLNISLSWMRSEKSCIVRYEDLWRDPVPALKELTDAIRPVETERIERAIALCDFNMMRARPGVDTKFFRRGTVGDWKTSIPNAILDILRHSDPYPSQFATLGYTLELDDPLTTLPRGPRPPGNPFVKMTRFYNGIPVPMVVARLYLSLEPSLYKRWSDLGRTTADTFYSWLNARADNDPHRAGTRHLPIVTNLAYYVHQTHPGIREAFPDVFEEDRVRYIAWFVFNAQTEYDLDQAFIQPMVDTLNTWSHRRAAAAPRRPNTTSMITSLTLYIYYVRHDLQVAFPRAFKGDRLDFARWFIDHVPEVHAPDDIVANLVGRTHIACKNRPEVRNPVVSLLLSLRRELSSVLDRVSTRLGDDGE